MKSHDPGLLSVVVPVLTSRVAESNSAVILGCSRNNSAVGPVSSIGVQSQWGDGNPGSSQIFPSPAILMPTQSLEEV